MNISFAKISGFTLSLAFVLVATTVWSATSFNGSASLSYIKYDATENGKDIFSGNSLVQQYALSYNASNRHYRGQLNYYDLMVGYDLTSFDTSVAQSDTETAIKQNSGRLRYSGDIGYKVAQFPLRFRAYTHDNSQMIYIPPATNIFDNLLENPLAYNVLNEGKRVSSGFSLAFEPKTSSNTSLRTLPSVYIDYEETVSELTEGRFSRIDNKTREISVAGLNQQNNWVNYRLLNYDDYLRKENSFVWQKFQIGHVDQKGRRKWSALTNWIDVSADGQLATRTGYDSFEEYDLNFMAIATRRTWTARTFMNYNRKMDTSALSRELTETARIPLYIKGLYGPETDWYMRFSAERGTRIRYEPAISNDTSYSDMASLGATTFKRALFTLSPSLSATIDKGFGGGDALYLVAAIETSSTARYSRKSGLAAGLVVKYHDDGTNTQISKTWNNRGYLTASYRPDSKFSYTLSEELTFGTAAPQFQDPGQIETKKYLQSLTRAVISWTPTAAFSTSLDSLYVVQRNEDGAASNSLELMHRLSYDKKNISVRFNTRFTQKDNYSDLSRDNYSGTSGQLGDSSSFRDSAAGKTRQLTSEGNLQYRPDRYTDATLSYNYSLNEYNSDNSSQWQIKEKYSYNFFTRAGVIRNIATVSQEAVFEQNYAYSSYDDRNSGEYSRRYLLLSGRYSPLDKLSLYGSVRYGRDDPGSIVIYYNTGINGDFKLLSTSLDYSYAKRDSDNRIEKKLSATVRRTF